MGTLTILADWDDEAGVWVATSDDIIGLVTEAETLEASNRETVAALGGVAVSALPTLARGDLAAAGGSLPLDDWLNRSGSRES